MKRIEEIAKKIMSLENTIKATADKETKRAAMQEMFKISETLTLEDMLEIDEYITNLIDS